MIVLEKMLIKKHLKKQNESLYYKILFRCKVLLSHKLSLLNALCDCKLGSIYILILLLVLRRTCIMSFVLLYCFDFVIATSYFLKKNSHTPLSLSYDYGSKYWISDSHWMGGFSYRIVRYPTIYREYKLISVSCITWTYSLLKYHS